MGLELSSTAMLIFFRSGHGQCQEDAGEIDLDELENINVAWQGEPRRPEGTRLKREVGKELLLAHKSDTQPQLFVFLLSTASRTCLQHSTAKPLKGWLKGCRVYDTGRFGFPQLKQQVECSCKARTVSGV